MTSPYFDTIQRASLELEQALDALTVTTPAVGYTYNYLNYARAPFEDYLSKYLPRKAPIEALFLGMNPGPWGTAQNGVPFGDMESVTDWLNVSGEVGQPEVMSPKRVIEGFELKRREVSGERLWGWIKDRWKTPDRFFTSHFIWSHCPLMYIHTNGSRNITPDRLNIEDRKALYPLCDTMLDLLIDMLEPRQIVGIGNYATARAKACVKGRENPPQVLKILHPSPASPAANAGWRERIEEELFVQDFAFANATDPPTATSFGVSS